MNWWQWWPAILLAAAYPPVWALSLRRLLLASWEVRWAYTGGVLTVVDLVSGGWPATLTAAVNCIIGIVLWWWNRRKRGRAKAWLGAKSRALRDVLVRKQREARKPRPVLRPVPGGAQ